ncbi:methylamine utilization protein MauE [Sphingobium sp. BYY-5]|uniref:MauE/DoxX family redox-associated membrane protein n=1 Tax=Sphingobium sp. BYY-5 TaxID=2926400 RepID=UPI001FA7D288|nr:MauE/DoxX family redox-associated membrane protein [Sphingobium sp. BYY-5]MCI4590472.1 methylamine utilization protein MauE [Sphingobium sp. BYY-5]
MATQALALFGLTTSIAVGLLFLIAGIAQWRHRALLPGVIANYRLLPASLVGPAATALPLLEVATGAALLLGLHPLAVLVAMALLLLFARAMAVNILRGRGHIDCGCGHGALRHPIGWPLVMRNIALAAVLALRLLPVPPFAPMDFATALAGGIAIALLCLLFQSLAALAAPSASAPMHRR